MDSLRTSLTLIPLLPLVGFLVNGFFGKRIGKRPAAFIACLGPAIGFVFATRLLRHLTAGGEPVDALLYTWIEAGDLTIDLRFACDQLTAVMLMVVTGVGTLIHIYSSEYMATEPEGGYARYFAYLNLFTAMMLVLVCAANLPLMFVGWEGVGLCSYLLIGFWYKDLKNARAGRKAFIVNRVGDFGFLLGIFLLWVTFDTVDFSRLASVDIASLLAMDPPGIEKGVIASACLLLFLGATGKSAQIPLYVWLPDAMAGPTPVSALIHAATMVTAGVYMIARLGNIFLDSGVLIVVAGVGVLTALIAATMALTERDLKKVLAYSTISQLGYMFVGVGTGVYAAGIFHLMTHAFFKALLFLGAGAVMHAVHHMDMEKMGGLKQKMPLTYWVFLVGALSLAGIPPFSGFFSKDEILTIAFTHFLHGQGAGWLAIWILGVVTAALTAFYTIRAFSLTFHGENRGEVDTYLHAHDPGYRIVLPLVVLAALALVGGFFNVSHLFGGHARLFAFLEPALQSAPHEEAHGAAVWFAVIVPTLLGILSAGSAYWIYTERPDLPGKVARRPALGRLLEAARQKYWVDEAYGRVFVQPALDGARALWRFVDVALIDYAVNRVGQIARDAAAQARRTQSGLLPQYVFYFAGGAVVLLVAVLMAG